MNERPPVEQSVIVGELMNWLRLEMSQANFLFKYLLQGRVNRGFWSLRHPMSIPHPEREGWRKVYTIELALRTKEEKIPEEKPSEGQIPEPPDEAGPGAPSGSDVPGA